jgi:hypothetical protein
LVARVEKMKMGKTLLIPLGFAQKNPFFERLELVVCRKIRL